MERIVDESPVMDVGTFAENKIFLPEISASYILSLRMQIWHFATMPGVQHCNINFNVDCSGTPYCFYAFSSHPLLTHVHWVK
jgi:hypothetical protein